MYSNSSSTGLRRDLTVAFAPPVAKIPLVVRPLSPADDLSALDPAPGISSDEATFIGDWVMGAAMSLVAQKAADHGARWVITFVDEQNAASFKGCIRAGFSPYVRRCERFGCSTAV